MLRLCCYDQSIMNRTLILDCKSKVGEQVKICGFVYSKRDHGKISFLDITDRSGIVQVVVANTAHLGGAPARGGATVPGGSNSFPPPDGGFLTGKDGKRPGHP